MMDGCKYQATIEENFREATKYLRLGAMFTLQQDNDPNKQPYIQRIKACSSVGMTQSK